MIPGNLRFAVVSDNESGAKSLDLFGATSIDLSTDEVEWLIAALNSTLPTSFGEGIES